MSCIDDSSRKGEQDTQITMDENIPEDQIYGRTGDTTVPKIPVLNKSDIIGCTFIMPPQEDGQKFRVHIVKMIGEHKIKLVQDPDNTQFMEGKFMGKFPGTERGITQGDPASTMIFNIVVDTMARAVPEEVC